MQRAAGSGAVCAVMVRATGQGWQTMHNTYGAAWEISNAPTMPVDLFIVSDDGQEVINPFLCHVFCMQHVFEPMPGAFVSKTAGTHDLHIQSLSIMQLPCLFQAFCVVIVCLRGWS